MEQDGRSSAYGEATDPLPDPVARDQRVETTTPVAGESLAATIAALADPATRSPVPDTCPFLRTIDKSGALAPPFETPKGTNRCVAFGEPTPQSARQQLHVCLTSGHSNCPRYLRGALVAADALAAPPPTRGPSTPVIASALLLVAAAAMSVGFLLVRGGFDLPAVAAASRAAVASVPPALVPSPSTPAVSGSASPVPSAAPTSSPSPVREPAATDRASSDAGTNAVPAGANRDPGPIQQPLRAPRAVPRRRRLLGLHGPARRQSAEHRQLLRGAIRHRDRHEPADRRPDEHPHGRRGPHATTDPLTWRRSTTARSRSSRSTATGRSSTGRPGSGRTRHGARGTRP